jgi:hypothetical protein
MDIGALKRNDIEVWVPFLDGTVLVRYIPRDELLKLNKEATRNTWDKGARIQGETDPGKADLLLGRHVVKGWEGFTMGGEPYPYTPENCDFLMTKWVEFARFVNDTSIDLQVLMSAEKEEAEENLIAHIRARADFPGVNCERCSEARQVDGHIPECETEKGCIIPPLGEWGVKIMAIREKLVRLARLVCPAAVLQASGATPDDLDLLAKAEEAVDRLNPRGGKGGTDG